MSSVIFSSILLLDALIFEVLLGLLPGQFYGFSVFTI